MVLALLLIHVAMVTPWVERERTRSSDAAEQQRFGALPEIANLENALAAVSERASSTVEPALAELADELEEDLSRLDATVRQLAADAAERATEADGDDGDPPAIDPSSLPFEIADPQQLAAIRDALAEGGPGASGARYGLLAALDPVVEEQIAKPRFIEVNRGWSEEIQPDIAGGLGDAAAALPNLRLRFPEAKSEWGALEGALTSLRSSIRDFDVEPPSEPFWWASPESARTLEIGMPPATAEKIRSPLALDELLAAAELARSRYNKLADRLEQAREKTLAETAARDRREQSFAGLLADVGLDLRAIVTIFPLILGLVLAAALARRSQRLRELGMTTRLMIEEGGSMALRDWCLALLAGRLSDERTADEAWHGAWMRALGVLAAAFAWITIVALQVRELDGVDETRWLIITLLGAAAVLAAMVHRLIVARGLVRLFVADDSEPIVPAFEEPAAGDALDASTDDSELDGHTLR